MATETAEYEFGDVDTLRGVIDSNLPQADEKPLFTTTKHPESGYTVSNGSVDFHAEAVDTHKVVFNPDTGTQFGVVTDDYEIIQPPEFLGPLADEIESRDRDIEGFFTLFDGGARGYGQVLLNDNGIWPVDRQGRSEPVRAGVSVRWSHDGGISVKASAFAQDGRCRNTMRRVADSIYVKHTGDVEDRVDFDDEWSTVLDQLGAFSDSLEAVIEAGVEHVVWDLNEWHPDQTLLDVTDRLEKLDNLDVPAFMSEIQRDGIAGWIEAAGFPRYLAFEATKRLRTRLLAKVDNDADPAIVNAWDLYSSLTWALTHHARFDTGSSTDDRYHRIASDVLTNPMLIAENVDAEVRMRATPDDEEQEQLAFEADDGDRMRTFKERERTLREALAQ